MSRYTLKAPIEIECADGDVETEIQIARVGDYEHGNLGKFSITPQHCEQMAQNYARERAIGHERFITVGHPDKLDGAPAAGWITALRPAPGGLFARVRLLASTAQRIKAGEYRYFSPTFTTSGKDESGKSIGARLLSGAITNDPFLKGMQPFELSAVEATETDTMSDEQKPVAEETEAAPAKLSEAETQVVTLSEQVKSLTEQLAAKDAKILELAEIVRGHERKNDEGTIRQAVSEAERSGKLSPALRDTLLPGVATDPIAALAASPFRDAKALCEYLSMAPVVVDLGERKSTDASDPVSLSATPAADLERLSTSSGVSVEALKRAQQYIAARS